MAKYNAFISYSHSADSHFAPQLQRALEKFAKPWYKRRNLNIFRDESDLSATPHLWSNIVKAMDNAEYFIYLASPKAAASVWVSKEIEHWLKSHPLDSLLVVLTEGHIPWDYDKGSFKNVEKNSFPVVLEEEFKEEPFYVDMRDSKAREEVTLKHPIFKNRILKLAAQLHGMAPKDLAGEEVKQHRKMLRIRNWAISLLSIFFIGVVVASYFAIKKSLDLEAQVILTEEQRDLAIKQRDSARVNYLVTQAQGEPVPSKALRYAAEAYSILPDPEVIKKSYPKYQNQSIYTSFPFPEEFDEPQRIAFIEGDSTLVTYHDVTGIGIRQPLEISPGDDFVGETIIKPGMYLLWDLKGNLIDSLETEAFKGKYGAPFGGDDSKWDYMSYYDTLDPGPFNERLVVRDLTLDTVVAELALWENKDLLMNYYVSSSSKKLLGTWSKRTIISIWDLDSGFRFDVDPGKLLHNNRSMMVSTADPALPEYAVALSSNDSYLAVIAESEIQLWDLSNMAAVISLPISDEVNCARYTGDGNRILVTSRNGNPMVWDPDTGKVAEASPEELVDCNPRFARMDKNLELTGGRRQQVRLKQENGAGSILLGTTETIDYAEETPDGAYILTASENKLRKFKYSSYDKASNTFLPPLTEYNKNHGGEVADFVFDPKLEKMISIGFAGPYSYYNLWDMETGALIRSFPLVLFDQNFRADKPSAEFSPDGSKILLNYGDKLTIWNSSKTLEEVLTEMRPN